MKHFYFILIFLTTAPLISQSINSVYPLRFDIYGLATSGDTIVAHGSQGSAMISYDDAATWHQISPLDSGDIFNFFIEHDRLTAFDYFGNVSISTDGGRNWEVKQNLISDTIVDIARSEDYYFARNNDSLLKYDRDFKVVNKIESKKREFSTYELLYKSIHRNRINIINDHLYFLGYENINGRLQRTHLVKMDIDLTLIDTLDAGDNEFGNNIIMNYHVSENGLFFELSHPANDGNPSDRKDYFVDLNFNNIKDLNNNARFSTTDGKDIYFAEFFKNVEDYTHFKIYRLKDDLSREYITTVDCSVNRRNFDYNDWTVANGRITFASKNRFIASKKIGSDTTERISNLAATTTKFLIVEQITKSDYMILFQDDIYMSKDTANTFYEVDVDTTIGNISFRFRDVVNYYNKYNKRVYMFGTDLKDSAVYKDTAVVFYSDDLGQTFEKKFMKTHNTIDLSSLTSTYKVSSYDDRILFSEYYGSTSIHNFYDKDMNYIDGFTSEGGRNSFIYAENLNNMIVIKRTEDGSSKLQWTDNGRKDWNVLKSYSNSLYYYNQITINNTPHLVIISHEEDNNKLTVENLNLKTYELSTVLEKYSESSKSTHLNRSADSIYFCYGDTIHYTHISNFESNSDWETVPLPNNGKIMGSFHRAGNIIIADYEDDKNKRDIYRIKLESTITSVENRIEVEPYLLSQKPYPNPTNGKVNIDLKGLKSVSVYNLQMQEVKRIDNIGTNTIDITELPAGVYFLEVEDINGDVYFEKIVKR